jgi:tRNA/rRNA methyltransferase
VSFPVRVVIDVVLGAAAPAAAKARADRHAWLAARDYRVIEIAASDIDADLAAVLARLAESLDTTTAADIDKSS